MAIDGSPPPDSVPSENGAAEPLGPSGVESVCEHASPLRVTEFLESPSAHVPPGDAPSQPLPGPGLPESLAWTLGVFAAHLAATVVLFAVIVVLMLFSGEMSQVIPDLDATSPNYLMLLIGGDQMLVLLAAIVAASLRFAGRLAPTLNVSAPHPLHVAIVAGLVLPLSSLSGEVYRVVDLGWQQVTDAWPLLRFLDDANSVEWLSKMSHVAPLPLMLLIIAVGPALGEELVFRGVIGRGLVARWGLPLGVLMTSLLFGAVHLHPVHAIAVVPLGIAMHLTYLATRSFWAPVLLHFLNNSWATVASRMAHGAALDADVVNTGVSFSLLVASAVAVVVLGALLYHTRTRYLLADGEEWSPGYVTTESPPRDLPVTIDRGMWTGRNLVTAVTAWASFVVAFVAEIAAYAR